jgi:poly-gamma-glutamate synthase PgsB/CapB
LTITFIGERFIVSRHLSGLSVRIAVTGTRGKSTVTRLIAAALREAGYSVLAKTTGSRPVLILPDGREEVISRRGLPTILEGKKVLKRASELRARALVAELMSIQPECLRVESCRIIQPMILVITNARLDHREEMGWTKPEIARSLTAAIPAGSEVFLPDSEFRPEFAAVAEKRKARIIRAPDDGRGFVEQGRNLVLAVTSSLGVADETSLRGMARALPDFGSLRLWEAQLNPSHSPWLLASAFAANDPESSSLILDHLRQKIDLTQRRLIGILNFRPDRGDRTRQWLAAHRQGFFSGFARVYIVGAHVHALRLRKKIDGPPLLTPLGNHTPASLMGRIAADSGEAGVIVGLGNIGGLGAEIVAHWEAIGRPYAI